MAHMDENAAIPNPPKPTWWDATWHEETEPEHRWDAVMPGSQLPCGCHIRRSDFEAILCSAHLAEINEPHILPGERP